MKSLLPIFLSATLFAACATTPEEQQARAEREANRLKQTYGQTCEKLGYESETNKWRDCLLELESQRLMERMNWYYPGYYSPFYYSPFCHHHGGRLICH
jgi:hypothetical protein